MSRRKKDPLRALSAEERAELERLGRSGREPAAVVAHAKAVLAVANGATYTAAARAAGRRGGARAMPLPTWSPASTAKGWRRSICGTAGDPLPAIPASSGSASWPKPSARLRTSPSRPPPGRW